MQINTEDMVAVAVQVSIGGIRDNTEVASFCFSGFGPFFLSIKDEK